jgi:hypothetical protein
MGSAHGISELLVVAVVVREVLFLLIAMLASGTILLLILCRKLVIAAYGSPGLASIVASVLATSIVVRGSTYYSLYCSSWFAAWISSRIASINSSFSAICSNVLRILLSTNKFGNPALSCRNDLRFSCSEAFFLIPFSCSSRKKSSLLRMSRVYYFVFDFTFCW